MHRPCFVLSNWITTLCAVTLTAAIPISSCRSVSDRKTGLAGCCRSPPLERVVSLSLSFSASLAAFALRWSSIALAPSVPSPLRRLSPSPPPSYPLAYGPLSFPHCTRASARSLPLSSEWPLTCTKHTPPFLRSFSAASRLLHQSTHSTTCLFLALKIPCVVFAAHSES